MFANKERHIMQKLNLIERWAEDPNGFSVIEKVTNGGKGSGIFGHQGRPGLVGGSGDGGQSTLYAQYPEAVNSAKRLVAERPDEVDDEYLKKVEAERERLFELYGEDKDKADVEIRKWNDGAYMWDWKNQDKNVFSDIDVALSKAMVKESNDNSDVYRIQVDSEHNNEMAPTKFASWTASMVEAYRFGKFMGGRESSFDLFKTKVSPDNVVIVPDVMYAKSGLFPVRQYEYVLKNDKPLKAFKAGMTWQEVSDQYEELRNSVSELLVRNGGKGSGNFGHYGRPGEVGGSAPRPQGIPVSQKQNPSSAYLIKHKEAIMQRMGYNEALFQAMVDDVRAIEIQDKAIEKADIEKWEKEYRPELERLGISQGTIDTVDKIVRRHAEKNESTRTEGQAEAIDNLISDTGVILAKGDETYMRNSVPEEMVKTIHDELNKAKEDGIDISKVQLQFVTATQQSGNCTLGQNGVIKIRLNRKEHSDLKYFREKLDKHYNDKWWTAKDIGASIRHELGHAMVWQAVKDCNLPISMYNKVAVDTVKRANREWVRKTGKSQKELDNNKGFKYMSQYGTNSSHEALAEAYAGENYSDYTKILADALRWTKRYY